MPPSPESQSLQVLLVEDEVLIRMLFEEVLEDLGHSICGVAGSLDEAVALAQTATADVAVLDVHLQGVAVYPVAEVLDARGIPFLFATGYSGADVPEKFRDRPTVQKPFQAEQLQELLTRCMAADRA